MNHSLQPCNHVIQPLNTALQTAYIWHLGHQLIALLKGAKAILLRRKKHPPPNEPAARINEPASDNIENSSREQKSNTTNDTGTTRLNGSWREPHQTKKIIGSLHCITVQG
jgi:hypothetical protein